MSKSLALQKIKEGFNEGVKKSEVSLPVVDELSKGDYNECFGENGVLYIENTPRDWTANVADTGRDVLDLL